MRSRKLVRLALDGEHAWGEFVEETEVIGVGVYRALNSCFDGAVVKLDPKYTCDDPKLREYEGKRARIAWGCLLTGVEDGEGMGIKPINIIGIDRSPSEKEE